MRLNQRRLSVILLGLLILSPMSLFAQSNTIDIAGSEIAGQLLESLIDTADIDLNYTVAGNGTTNGIAAFCNSAADVVTTTRPLTIEEENLCQENEVNFSEIVLGYQAITFIAHPSLNFLDCATLNEIGTAIAPSAIANTSWADVVNNADTETNIRVFLPPSDSVTYFLADETINGIGFRSDAVITESDANTIEQVQDTPGAIGVISLNNMDMLSDNITAIAIRNNTIAQCVSPSIDAVGEGAYLPSVPMLAYINDASMTDETWQETLTYIANSENRDAVVESDYIPPSDFDYTTNQEVVSGEKTGRQFSRRLTDFQIPPTVTGTVNVGGAAGAFGFLNAAATQFSQTYQTVTLNINTLGETVGIQQFCSGELDIVAVHGEVSQDTLADCNTNEISPVVLPIGEQATVLVANETANYLECLTTEDITTTWRADVETPVSTWQAVNSDYPAEEFILFADTPNSLISNLMMQQASGQNIPMRLDIEENSDPLYRAAATANVETALTYMSWEQHQNVLTNGQERIQLVAVDNGSGCVLPTPESITNGEYPLARSTSLLVNSTSLQRIEVQSYLWFMLQDNRLTDFQRNNFNFITLKTLFDLRDTLQSEITQAVAATTENTATEETSTDAETEEGNTDTSGE